MPSQTKLIGHQMFESEVLCPGLATPVALTVFTVVAATDWLIGTSPSVFSTLISPIERRRKGAGDGADRIPDYFSLFDDICFASPARPPSGSGEGGKGREADALTPIPLPFSTTCETR